MNKTDLCAKIAEATEVNKKDVKAVIDALPEIFKDVVSTGDKINLVGFMTVEKVDVKERTGISKMSGENKPWTVPAHSEVKVSLSKGYRQF